MNASWAWPTHPTSARILSRLIASADYAARYTVSRSCVRHSRACCRCSCLRQSADVRVCCASTGQVCGLWMSQHTIPDLDHNVSDLQSNAWYFATIILWLVGRVRKRCSLHRSFKQCGFSHFHPILSKGAQLDVMHANCPTLLASE